MRGVDMTGHTLILNNMVTRDPDQTTPCQCSPLPALTVPAIMHDKLIPVQYDLAYKGPKAKSLQPEMCLL